VVSTLPYIHKIYSSYYFITVFSHNVTIFHLGQILCWSQMVTVRMTVDDLEKWYQFKNNGTRSKVQNMVIRKCAAAVCAAWLIDLGASRHMAGSYGEFHDYVRDFSSYQFCLWGLLCRDPHDVPSRVTRLLFLCTILPFLHLDEISLIQ
jgi:hypothetical protein